MIDLFAERFVAFLIGLVLGLIFAIALLVSIADIDQWWVLVVVPVVCGVVCALIGNRAVESLKRLVWWSDH